jgi:glucose-6-phosphate dehydrogenase assembly protein OpcA
VSTLWDTTGSDVVDALAAERRAAGAVASGLALTLIVVVDEKQVGAAEAAATVAAQTHPCRLVIVVRRKLESDDRLDAEVTVGGRLGPAEAVVLRMYGRLTLHAESVVLPLLAPDAPVVTWWHGPPPDEIAVDPLGVLAGRRVTDCAQAADPGAALLQRAHDFAPGDTDLAWTRTTSWRALLASAFDDPPGPAESASVRAEAGDPSALLLGGWIASRLGPRAEQVASPGPGVTEVRVLARPDGGGEEPVEIVAERPDGRLATLHRTGHPDRRLPLVRRQLGDLLAEEVRRLEADPIYAEALAAATGVGGLGDRPAKRRHIWRDPATTGT